jgi:D-glycero-alpha-D-manno-heptose 1-phosphate guanylyltransferase
MKECWRINKQDFLLEAIILAGGFGIRLQPVVSGLPKPMAPVNGRPFLEYILDYLIKQSIDRCVISVGYKKESIINHFRHHYHSITINYAIEEEPLGTGGGIRNSFLSILGDRAIVMNGDSIFLVTLNNMLHAHLKKRAEVTIALREISDTGRYGRVTMNHRRRISGFEEKRSQGKPGYINTGVYIIEKKFLMGSQLTGAFSLEKDCFERCTATNRIYGYPMQGYFIDIGVPEDYERAQNDFKRFDRF